MKNLFTFIVALFMATSVYAQGTYAVANGEQFTPDYKISKVPNITVYYMANAGNVFNAGKKTANWADSDFNYYASIKTGDAANYDGKSEPTGAYLKFEPKNDGTIIVGIQIDKFKELCLVGSDFARITDYTYNLPSAAGQVSQTLGTNNKTADTKVDNCLTIKSNGTVTLNVKAGNTYYLMALGSKIGFFGFKYLVNEKVTITDAGFATFAASYPVDYSANGLEAYAVKYADGKLTYNQINGIVPADKAVLLKGEAKEYTLAAAGGAATTVDTDLQVADGNKKGATNIYCLANKNNGVGFYQVSSDVIIPANKAYLEINAANSAKYYSIGIGGNTTGIQAIQQNSVKADGIMYSLSGQRVGKDYKGIVICNGKKMIKK
mgnify:CR=1 FL=1